MKVESKLNLEHNTNGFSFNENDSLDKEFLNILNKYSKKIPANHIANSQLNNILYKRLKWYGVQTDANSEPQVIEIKNKDLDEQFWRIVNRLNKRG